MIKVRAFRCGKGMDKFNRKKKGQFLLTFDSINDLVAWVVKNHRKNTIWLIDLKKDLTKTQLREYCIKVHSILSKLI